MFVSLPAQNGITRIDEVLFCAHLHASQICCAATVARRLASQRPVSQLLLAVAVAEDEFFVPVRDAPRALNVTSSNERDA
jgi:hypothetical protein